MGGPRHGKPGGRGRWHEQGQTGGALHQSGNTRLAVGALDQVALPVAELHTQLDLGGALLDGGHVLDAGEARATIAPPAPPPATGALAQQLGHLTPSLALGQVEDGLVERLVAEGGACGGEAQQRVDQPHAAAILLWGPARTQRGADGPPGGGGQIRPEFASRQACVATMLVVNELALRGRVATQGRHVPAPAQLAANGGSVSSDVASDASRTEVLLEQILDDDPSVQIEL